MKQVQFFQLSNSIKYEIFKFKNSNGRLELHLNYDFYEIGEPKRDNFKLCNLELNKPVELKINGKLDCSLSSGRERSFKEHCYIFHLIGETNEFELQKEPFTAGYKKIPQPQKTVDLLKVLY